MRKFSVLNSICVLIFCCCFTLTGCNGDSPSIPFNDTVEHITIKDQKSGETVNEINDALEISEFLKLMNSSKISGFGDSEPPGEIYTILFEKDSNKIMFYFKNGMTRTMDDKIYYDKSKHRWVPDKLFLKYFP
ncbi:hypothetical protein QFZ81_004025 [Paenibacillus sp. V4I9]|uniref:hypothetical protein n=1 Tax=Paenibacillus sp. V4I9 TaxID=3042308 RepID=UPI002786EA86|nr:hypothetical protein [Paenibacillus sp. V4I9]MDQ0888937.1 hypothetical protein [Paenibacillus sp. V4I9]